MYQQRLKRDPDNYRMLLNAGVYQHVVGDMNEAGDCYPRIIKEGDDAELVKRAKQCNEIP